MYWKQLSKILAAMTLGWVPSLSASETLDFNWRQDPDTGLMVAQLTDSRANNNTDYHALYYHQNSLSADGRYLIYRGMRGNAAGTALDADTRVFHRLDLITGETVPLTDPDQASAAFVFDDQVFFYHRESSGTRVNTVSRIPIQGGARVEVYRSPDRDFFGSIAMSSNGRFLIYQTTDRDGHLTQEIGLLELDANGDMISNHPFLSEPTPRFQHFQFSSTDPGLFTYIDQDRTLGARLNRLYIGRVYTGATKELEITLSVLSPPSPGDPLTSYTFPHAFWGLDGRLWCDGIKSSLLDNAFIHLSVDSEPGSGFGDLDPAPLLLMTDTQWQLHQSTSRALNWYAGDGEGDGANLGVEFIHMLRLDDSSCEVGAFSMPCGEIELVRLSSSLGAADQRGGNWEANAKTLLTLDGVIFSAPWSFNSLTELNPIIVTGVNPDRPDEIIRNRARNLFLVKLPNRLKARLNAQVQDQQVEGPWKPGHRVTVDAKGMWSVDYTTPSGFGDGVVDQTFSGTVGDAYALADINGDDVDDRVTWQRRSTGGWIAEVSRSDYDGTLVDEIHEIVEYPAHTFPWPVLGDLDGNGMDDLALAYPRFGGVEWLGYLNTEGTLPEADHSDVSASYFGDSSRTNYAFLADVNGDGYGDRVVVEAFWDVWSWFVDYSTENGFGDGVADSSKEHFGYISLDRPLVADVNGDGMADLVLARGWQGANLEWIAHLSDETGFGASETSWSGNLGIGGNAVAIGHLSRFQTSGN